MAKKIDIDSDNIQTAIKNLRLGAAGLRQSADELRESSKNLGLIEFRVAMQRAEGFYATAIALEKQADDLENNNG